MSELLRLAQSKNTDKGTLHRAYIPVYEALFAPLRNGIDPVLEVGVQYGGSIELWHDYFPAARIYGIDIAPARPLVGKRSVYLEGDAYTEDAVRFAARFGPYAVLIDDGPHSAESQRFFIEHYSQLLTADGVLIVEDVPAVELAHELATGVPAGFVAEVRDLRRFTVDLDGFRGADDDILVIVRRVPI